MRILSLFFERNIIHTKRSTKRTYTYTKRTSVHQAVIYCIRTHTVLKYTTLQGTLFGCQIVFEKAFYHVVHTLPYICRTHIKFVRQNIFLSLCRRLLFATMADHICVHQEDMCSPSEHIYVHQAFIYYICTQTVLKFATYPPCSLCKWNFIRESFLSRHLHCIRRIHITKYKLSSLCRMLLFLYIVFINV